MGNITDKGEMVDFTDDSYIVIHPDDLDQVQKILDAKISRVFEGGINYNLRRITLPDGGYLSALSSANTDFYLGVNEVMALENAEIKSMMVRPDGFIEAKNIPAIIDRATLKGMIPEENASKPKIVVKISALDWVRSKLNI